MAHLATLQMANAAAEQVQRAEALARELTDRLEKFEQANDATELKVSELSRERNALTQRIAELEAQARGIIAGQPEVIVDALRSWLKSDAAGLAKALHGFMSKAVT